MAFYGKVFAVEREENYEEFVKSLGLPADKAANLLQYKPSQKVEKNGDEYTFTVYASSGDRSYKCKSGVEFADTFLNQNVKVVITVDGNKLTQVINFEIGFNITIKKEYTDDSLSEEISHSGWDGAARRFYKAQ